MTKSDFTLQPRAWTPTIEAAKTEFESLIQHYARQIDPAKGTDAYLSFRNLIGSKFPGAMPAPMAMAIMIIVAANAISSLSDEMENALQYDTPGAMGRRKAVTEFFERIINAAADDRERQRIQSMLNPGLIPGGVAS